MPGGERHASPPIGGGPQDLTPCPHTRLALCPNSPTPFSPAAWPGFYLSSPELITVSFVPT